MTNKRNSQPLDERVSETYSELEAPRAPDHLNETILQMAAIESDRKSNLLFAPWMKPIAWAATIGLSLAIVLQLTELPTSPAVDSQQRSTIAADGAAVQDEPAVLLQELSLEDVASLKGEAKGKNESYAASAPAGPAASTINATACDATARQSASDWLDCIDNLRASGASDEAEREYDALILKYPAAAVDSGSNK